MREMYSNAVITITANAASSCAELFLKVHERGKDGEGIKIPHSFLKGSGYAAFARLAEETSHGPIYTHYYAIEDRGWTLQEYLLSRRLLIFEYGRVFFHCMESTDSEDGMYADMSHGTPAGLREEWALAFRNGASDITEDSLR
jgi:hypothetical protein